MLSRVCLNSRPLLSFTRAAFATDLTRLKKTALVSINEDLGGRFVDYAGWAMPIQYLLGTVEAHLHTRKKAGLFDVSHMVQVIFRGKDRAEFLEKLVVGSVKELRPFQASLSLITNEKGGIKDDCVISNHENSLYVVINAGCAEKDLAHFREHLEKNPHLDVKMEVFSEKNSLIALQGPLAATVLSRHVSEDLNTLKFMHGRFMKVSKVPCLVTRCGYTGEDGFEISIPHDEVARIFKLLLETEEVKPVGLGARDTLRLEAGLCLYGNDINEDISPLEAGLAWTIGKRRREEGGFLGAETILAQLKDSSLITKKRVGLIKKGSGAREHFTLHDVETKEKIGEVTSGLFSPVLKHPVAMGYVSIPYTQVGTKLLLNHRGEAYPIEVAKMPFVPTNYFK